MAELYVARETFTAVIEGRQEMVRKGRDLVRAGHPLLKQYPTMFKPARVRFDVEQATASPGEKRGDRPRGTDADPFPRHVGGGWYETPDGERHHGRDDALDHMLGPQD